MFSKEDTKALTACMAGSFAAYHVFRALRRWMASRSVDWVPVGRVKELHIYPVKSCKSKRVFSAYLDAMGTVKNENKDRMFLVVDGTGLFFSARRKPQMVLVECDVGDGSLHLKYGGTSAEVSIKETLARNEVFQCSLHSNLRTDGYDCGEEAAKFFAKVVNDESARRVMYSREMFTERICKTDPAWWNNEVPNRKENTGYAAISPYMITSQASLDVLNNTLDRNDNPILNVQFRAYIVIDGCEAWDEDKWLDLRFGDQSTPTAQLQCFRPCTRCIITIVSPSTGEKDPEQQPLKLLKETRMAPGGLRNVHGESPIFGVNAAVDKKGYIYEGQIVYVKYKPSEF